jgi:hypothetical protein
MTTGFASTGAVTGNVRAAVARTNRLTRANISRVTWIVVLDMAVFLSATRATF